MKKRVSKKDKILKYLQTHKRGLTQAQAIDKFRAYRLADTVFQLKKKGYNIITIIETNENQDGTRTRYGRYVMV